MKRLLSILAVALLSGCVNGVPSPATTNQVSETNQNNVEKIFVGLPALFSIEATAVRLNKDWMITAAHNKPILEMTGKEVYYHPTCDVAVYKSEGHGESQVGVWNEGDTLTNVGYPAFLPLSTGEGEWLGNIYNPNSNFKDCIVAATKASTMVGMSGGAVYNEAGELVGIIHGYNSQMTKHSGETIKDVSLFTSLWVVKDWLNEVTGGNYFE